MMPQTASGDGVFSVNEGGSYTLTTTDLSASDVDTSDGAEQLTWTVTTLPTQGMLALMSDTTIPISSFTQQQLVAGDVIYVHGGDEPATESFVVQVADDDDATAMAQTINVTVMPVNDNPVLDDSSFTVLASAADDSEVGTIVATDADSLANTLRYSIVAGGTAPDGLFEIGAMSGAISIANNTNLGAINASHTLVIQVSDDAGGTSTATITVEVGGAIFATAIDEGATGDFTVQFATTLENAIIVDGSVSTTATGVTATRVDAPTPSASAEMLTLKP